MSNKTHTSWICSATQMSNILKVWFASSTFCSSGDCLLDQPQKLLALPDDPPGVSYSLSRQCELAFGSGSKPCPYMQPCSKLWCTGKAKGQLVCQTRHFPWADGTTCGSNKLCYRGICIDKQNTTKDKVSDVLTTAYLYCILMLFNFNISLFVSLLSKDTNVSESCKLFL